MGPGIQKYIWLFFAAGLVCFSGAGCSPPPAVDVTEYVIKCGDILIEKDEFLEELDMKLAAYPYDIKKDPAEYNEMIMDLVLALTEQSQLLNAAAQMGIQVSDEEVDQAEKLLREDYPEDSFEQILLENALPYEFWKKKLKQSMIMEELIQRELREKVKITPEELVSFYDKVADEYKEEETGEGRTDLTESGSELVERLRREKSQDQYNEWIQKLKLDFPAEINKDAIAKFLIGKDKGHIND
ncbi:SurA N-terminal domain-containing protein [Desulfospira joergensenii]|uniref:SurA N-terminal domain-containing protein n=1 Tax=Desulfospira joergensenii TaxID=53329 RepID=UPI0003B59938|nr:SurA N-terminal domain-containing protein [Desulfospira joergensenii]